MLDVKKIEVNIPIDKALDSNLVKSASDWLYRIFGEPIENGVGLLFADRLKYRRMQNATKLQAETEKIAIQNTKKIPLSFGYKLFDKATLEDDDFLISKWANLLASSVDADYNGEIRKIFIDILDSLEPLDARVLDNISMFKVPSDPFVDTSIMSKRELTLSIDSLLYHNLITEDYDSEFIPIKDGDWDDPTEKEIPGSKNGKYFLTDLGESFVMAVNRSF